MQRRDFLMGVAACSLTTRIPAPRRSGLVALPVQLNGRDATMVLDTGAERSLLTRAAVDRLKLALDPWVGTTLRGAGGLLEENRNASVSSVRLGGVALTQRGPGAAVSMAVSRSADLGGMDGLLGGDLLGHLDLDLDVPGGSLTLTDPDCPAPGVAVVLTRLRRALLLAPVRLDGQDLTALLDTGATMSLLNARGMHRLGIAADYRAQSSHAKSIGGTFAAEAHRFRSLALGPLSVGNPVVMAYPIAEPAYDMIVGLDLLGQRRLRLSNTGLRLVFPA